MVCDFFYPRLGGVEMHTWSVAQCLIQLGHKVIVCTGNYAASDTRRVGVRYMTNGLKVYYLPLIGCLDQAIFPTYYAGFKLFRELLLREQVDVVHGHAATSIIIHECLLQARVLGLRAVYTDHSLFNFADPAHLNINKYSSFTLADIDHAIGVSHTSRENLIRRCRLDPRDVSAIPNAVDATKFTPMPNMRSREGITVVMVSRLVYRKGVDLAAEVIPRACAAVPGLKFIIGGDGPKRLLLEEMRERHGLHDRITLLGAVPHTQVPDLLRSGHIFLNTSLTESFCIAILEAACTGCFVVSTNVGGVPEVLPPHMMCLAQPNALDLTRALLEAIPKALACDPTAMHASIAKSYSWMDVAQRTQRIYETIMRTPTRSTLARLKRHWGNGPLFGPISIILVCMLQFMAGVMELLWPARTVSRAPDIPWQDTRNQLRLVALQLRARPGPKECSSSIAAAPAQDGAVTTAEEEAALAHLYALSKRQPSPLDTLRTAEAQAGNEWAAVNVPIPSVRG